MPELPEVETVRRTLAPAIGATVTRVWTSGKTLHLGRAVDERALAAAAERAALEDVRRIGKYLLLDFTGRTESVVIHLGMSGRLRLVTPPSPPDPHLHALFSLRYPGGAAGELQFRDPRRFGLVTTVRRGRERDHPSLAGLGVDPLAGSGGEGIGEEALAATLEAGMKGRNTPIKAALLDQRVIAGIGNIYASEALWEARIHPQTPARAVTRPRARALAVAISTVLDRALGHGGTSLRDFVAADGATGDNAHYLWVYGRAGAPCPRSGCSGRITRAVLQGRATFYCSRCQRRRA